MTQRELAEAWEAAIAGSGLPVAMSDAPTPRPRIAFGAPIPMGVAAEAELIDVYLTERVPTWQVREALQGRLPAGWSLGDLYDVWLAGPALPGQVAAAVYRIVLAPVERAGVIGTTLDASVVASAAASLLAARSLPRERIKGGGPVPYDLRPLLVGLAVRDPGPPVVVAATTRFHPELGSGRPEEVIAALGEAIGCPLAADAVVRERLLLVEELERGGPPHRFGPTRTR